MQIMYFRMCDTFTIHQSINCPVVVPLSQNTSMDKSRLVGHHKTLVSNMYPGVKFGTTIVHNRST